MCAHRTRAASIRAVTITHARALRVLPTVSTDFGQGNQPAKMGSGTPNAPVEKNVRCLRWGCLFLERTRILSEN